MGRPEAQLVSRPLGWSNGEHMDADNVLGPRIAWRNGHVLSIFAPFDNTTPILDFPGQISLAHRHRHRHLSTTFVIGINQ